mgnify:CR=1 FL=1
MSKKRIVDFVVIGAQKAGSTFLLQCLEEHPEVFMVHWEVPFFQDPDYAADKVPQLEEMFRGQESKRARGLKRPNYLGDPAVPGRIARHYPDVKLIAVLRHPVERTVSAYFHYMQNGFLPVSPIETGLRRLLDQDTDSRFPNASQVIEFSRYGEHLERYLRHFSRDQMLIARFEEIRDSPLDLIRRSCEFIGVASDYQPERTERRPMASIYSIPRLRLLATVRPVISTFYHDRRRMRYRGWTGKQLSRIISRVDRSVLARLFPNRKPQLSQDLQDRLNDAFKDDTNHLRELLNDSLPGWPG